MIIIIFQGSLRSTVSLQGVPEDSLALSQSVPPKWPDHGDNMPSTTYIIEELKSHILCIDIRVDVKDSTNAALPSWKTIHTRRSTDTISYAKVGQIPGVHIALV